MVSAKGSSLCVCFWLLILLMMGCSSQPTPGRIATSRHDATTKGQADIVYSEYFQFDERILEGQVRMHLLITLGPERVPPNWWFPPSPFITDGKISKRSRADGIAEEVWEVYFTNLGDVPITFSPMELQARPFGNVTLSPSPMVLKPKEFIKTEPIINVGSIYQPPNREFAFRYLYASETKQVAGVARRLRVDELQ